MTTKLTGSLRLIMAAGIVLAVIVPGYLNRSAWIIALATPAYTALYAFGKWDAWKLAWRTGGLKMILLSIASTLPIQLILVAILYMIGLGASMLFGSAPGIQALSSADIMAAIILFVVASVLSAVINVIEAKAGDDASTPSGSYVLQGEGRLVADPDVELDMNPTPLTPQTFYVSPGHWRADELFEALEGRGTIVEKKPEAATEEAIIATEARLGVRLPEGLRDLYKIMDGGYVGEMYVPLKANAGLVYDDWRGAFSIDYSSLYALDKLGTVTQFYESFTDDPDDIPANGNRMIVLQARYQDMTLLDYTHGPDARVRLVDFEGYAEPSSDIEFPDFDSFFAALRRPREHGRMTGEALLAYRKKPIAEYMPAQQPSEFWGANAHYFVNRAESPEDGFRPAKQADDALIAATEARLGIGLPPALVELWRYRNGGTIAAGYLQVSGEGEAYDEIDLPEQLMPMEYFATLAEASSRIRYPAGETPLAARHRDADKLVLIEARQGNALILDYRDHPADPAVLIVENLAKADLSQARRIENFGQLLKHLRAGNR